MNELFPKSKQEDPQIEELAPLVAKNPGYYVPFPDDELAHSPRLQRLIKTRMNERRLSRSQLYTALGVPRGYFDSLLDPEPNTNIRLAVMVKLAAYLDIPLVEVLLSFWPEDAFMRQRLPLIALLAQFLDMDERTQDTALTVLQALFKQGQKRTLTDAEKHRKDRLLVHPDEHLYLEKKNGDEEEE